MKPARAIPHRQPWIDGREILHGLKGDVLFWLGSGVGVFGWLAFVAYISDLYVNIGYLTQLSVFANKGPAVAILGGFIGLFVASIVHLGVHKVVSFTGRFTAFWRYAIRFIGIGGILGILGLSTWFAMTGAEDLWQMDLAANRAAVEQASGQRAVAENERSTDIEEAAVTRADAALTDARSRRANAEALQLELSELPAGVYSLRTEQIQTIIGAEPDGEKYNLTTDAMTAYVARMIEEEAAANEAYQAATTALTAKSALIESAVNRELQATRIEGEQSYLKTMRVWAEANLDLKYTPGSADQLTPEQIDANAKINETADEYAKRSGHAIAVILTLCSFGLGILRFWVKDEPYVPPVWQATLPPPADVDGGFNAEAVDRRDGRNPFAPQGAPPQEWETDESYPARLGNLDRLRAQLNQQKSGSKSSAHQREWDEINARAARLAEEKELREARRVLEDEERRLRNADDEIVIPETATSSRRAPSAVDMTEAIQAISRRMAERDAARASQPVTPRPEPEVSRNSFGSGVDVFDPQARLNELLLEFNQLDAEMDRNLKLITRSPQGADAMRARNRNAAIEDRMHKIHSEMEPLIAAVNRQVVT